MGGGGGGGGAGVAQETKGSTALKSLVADKSSYCIVQSANLVQHLRKSSHSEEVKKCGLSFLRRFFLGCQ